MRVGHRLLGVRWRQWWLLRPGQRPAAPRAAPRPVASALTQQLPSHARCFAAAHSTRCLPPPPQRAGRTRRAPTRCRHPTAWQRGSSSSSSRRARARAMRRRQAALAARTPSSRAQVRGGRPHCAAAPPSCRPRGCTQQVAAAATWVPHVPQARTASGGRRGGGPRWCSAASCWAARWGTAAAAGAGLPLPLPQLGLPLLPGRPLPGRRLPRSTSGQLRLQQHGWARAGAAGS
jgi:hypothetical protein